MISSGINLSMTVLGFAVSVMFIMFVCIRLLCARLHLRDPIIRRIESSLFQRGFAGFERGFNGVEPVVVDTFPIIKYNHEMFACIEDAVCTVCLGEYEEKDILRVLPTCGHVFHINCIDVWLRQHSTCPVCRLSLRGSYDGGTDMSPFISIAMQSRYSPRATSVNLSEHAYAESFNRNRHLFGATVPGQECSVISFASELNQCPSDFHDRGESDNERQHTLYYVTRNSHETEYLSGLHLNDAMNEHTKIVPQDLSEIMIDEMSIRHKPSQVLGNSSLVVCNPVAAQERQYSVSVQIDSNDTTGIASSSEDEQNKNVGGSKQVVEISNGVDKFHRVLAASGCIEIDVPLNLNGRERGEGIGSTDNSGITECLENSSIFSHIEHGNYTLQRNVDSSDRIAGHGLAVYDVRSSESV